MKNLLWKRSFTSYLRRATHGSGLAIALAATACVFAASAVHAQASRVPAPQVTAPNIITINRDMGGGVYHYAWEVSKAAHNGSHVRIRGACVSACTLYLAMPREQVCITPGARFSFHLPYGASRAANKQAAEYMMRKYPQWVRNWIAAKGGLSKNMIHMGSRYASQFMKTCGAASGPVYVSAQPEAKTPEANSKQNVANAVVTRASYKNTSNVLAKAEPQRQEPQRASKQRRRFTADR